MIAVRRLTADDLGLVATIDRSEHVDMEYRVDAGRLVERPVTMADIPPWASEGTGEFSVAHMIEFCSSAVAGGGELLGCFDGAVPMGLAIVNPTFDGGLAWLAFLHVSRPHRRRGVATALFDTALDDARRAGASALYVSATPTGSAVRFYLRQGCRLSDPVHPALFAAEPDDIHLVRPLDRGGEDGSRGRDPVGNER